MPLRMFTELMNWKRNKMAHMFERCDGAHRVVFGATGRLLVREMSVSSTLCLDKEDKIED